MSEDIGRADVVIVGSGVGGATLAYALKDRGASVLVLERGGRLPREPENWDAAAVFDDGRYKNSEPWQDEAGRGFVPGVHYYVGGNSKVFGAALPRFRVADFEPVAHHGGVSPGWPIGYDDLEPYYAQAEQIYRVHGNTGSDDPTEPPRSGPFPYPAVPDEPFIADLAGRLAEQGLHPSALPLGIDLRDGGACIRCGTCDGFPCRVGAKSDAEVCCVDPALKSPNVRLVTGARVQRLLTDPAGGRVVAASVELGGRQVQVRGGVFVVACGAANSASLLLRSAGPAHPEGLANGSGLVGRNYMVHNNSALMAVHPARVNATVFQKTLTVNDYYFATDDYPYPRGNLQLLGKLQAGMLTAAARGTPRSLLQAAARRSVDWWVMSEDLPDPENRVTVSSSGQITIRWQPNNLKAHDALTRAARRMLRRAGWPLVLVKRMGIETNSHQCGTARFGEDPATSVLDPLCRSHEVENLYVVDASFFPSSAATNPALTIAAQALRVADLAGIA